MWTVPSVRYVAVEPSLKVIDQLPSGRTLAPAIGGPNGLPGAGAAGRRLFIVLSNTPYPMMAAAVSDTGAEGGATLLARSITQIVTNLVLGPQPTPATARFGSNRSSRWGWFGPGWSTRSCWTTPGAVG